MADSSTSKHCHSDNAVAIQSPVHGTVDGAVNGTGYALYTVDKTWYIKYIVTGTGGSTVNRTHGRRWTYETRVSFTA